MIFNQVSLQRFHKAQANPTAGHEAALAELRRGRKRSHWIWYIFPQLAGMGSSATARSYALHDLAEACAYLRDPVLRGRYEEMAGVVTEQLAHGQSLDDLMGSPIDALKLASSLTLFRAAAESLGDKNPAFPILAQRLDALLTQTATQGYPACGQTLARLSAQRAPAQ